MIDSPATPRLGIELAAIEKWRQEKAQALEKSLVSLAGEEQELRERLAALQRSIESNAERQRTLQREQASLSGQVLERSRKALLDALLADRALVEARSAALQELRELAVVELKKRLDEPEVASAIEEYEKFREVEPVLGSLPPSYRQVVMDHHEALKARLEPLFELGRGPRAPLDLEPAHVMLAASLEATGGRATAFALFLPIDHQVYRGWADRPEDLAAQFAYRVVAGVSQALEQLGASDAPVVYQDFSGCISIQVWLDDHDLDADASGTIGDALCKALAGAPELGMARLGVEVAWVDPEIIGPEEEGEQERGAAAFADADSEDDKRLKPVQIVLRRGGSDHW